MGSESPNVILYDSNGDAMAVSNNTAIPSAGPGTSALLFAGSDGTNAHYILTDSSGRTIVVGAAAAGAAPAGNPNLVAGSVTTAAPAYTTATVNYFSLDTAGNLRVTGIGGTFPNASIGTTAAAPPASATYMGALVTTAAESGLTGGDMYPLNLTTTGQLRIDAAYPLATAVATAVDMNQVGGVVTTAAPTYTTATANALSLTTTGLLRIDGVYPVNATTPTSDITFVGGGVTTAAPAYTTGQLSALSLTTAGQLRIDGVSATGATAGADAMYVAGAVTTAAPTYTTGQMDPLSLTIGGLLRIDGVYPLAATTPTTDVTFVGGAVTTAAPTYTTGQLDPLSLDTSGNLRVTVGPVTVSQADITSTGTLNALNAATTITALAGSAGMGMQLLAGTLIGTIVPEISNDGGTTWVASFFEDPITGNKVSSIVFGAANTAITRMIITSGGASSVRVRVSVFTSGTATCNLRASTQIDTSAVLFDGAPNATIQPPTVAQVGGWDGTALRAFNTTPINGFNPLQIQETDPVTATSYPDPGNYQTTSSSSSTYDSFGNLQVRGPVFSDEGSLRDDFTGTALTTAITGNLTFTNGSLVVTGTNLQTQIKQGQYIKKTADAETLYVQVASIDTSTSLTLMTAYTGTSAAAASVVSNWQTVTPTSGTGAITVATSIMTMGCGTTANGTGSIRSLGDYLPYSIQFYAEVSQRIANQTLYMGVQDVVGLTPNQQATVQFSGTVNTTVNFVTCFANTTADTQTTAVTLPNNSTTATYHLYKIDLSSNQATLSIDGVVVAMNNTHIPSPYTDLYITAGVVNGAVAPASNTNFLIDYVFFENIDRVQIDTDFVGEPLPVLTQQVYGVNNETITITLNSLASAAQRQSTAVNNSSTVFRDALVQIQIKTAAAAVSTTGIVNIYAYASSNAGTTYGDTATGTDGVVTLTSPPNLKLIGTINAVANAVVYDSNPFSVAAVFGGKLPQYWGIVVENKTGAAFDATAGNFKAFYQGVLG